MHLCVDSPIYILVNSLETEREQIQKCGIPYPGRDSGQNLHYYFKSNYACVGREGKSPKPVSDRKLCGRQDTLKTRKIGFRSTGVMSVGRVEHG